MVHVSEGAKTASGVGTIGSWSASNGLMCLRVNMKQSPYKLREPGV